MQIAYLKNFRNGGEEVERGDVKVALTEAELREQDVSTKLSLLFAGC